MTLWSFANFQETFLDHAVDMNMQTNELMMSSPHNFPFILYTEITKKKNISAMRMLDLP